MATSYTTNLGLALPVQGELAGTWGDVVNQEITSLLDSAVAGTTTLSSDADVTLTDTDGAANQSRQAILLWTANGTVTRTITAPARTKAYIVINATAGTQSIKLVGAGPTTGITLVANEKCLAAWNGSDFVKVASTAVAPSQITGATTVGTNYLTLTNPGAITFPRMNADNTVSALNAADFRTAIGAGTGTGTVTSVAVSGGTTGLTTSGGPITTSGTITLAGTLATANGGTGLTSFTANGVVYASSTSALTTGSALQTNGQGLGIGVAPVTNVSLLDVETSTGRIQFRTGANTGGTSAGTGIVSINSGVIADLNYRASKHAWIVDSTEGMRLTNTGLGIGTSSPAYKLDVNGTTSGFLTAQVRNLSNSSSAAASYALGQDTNATAASIFLNSSTNTGFGGANSLNIYSALNAPIAFYTNGTERARIDASGNWLYSNNSLQQIKTATFNSQTTIATTSGSITVDWTTAQNQLQTEPTGTITYTFTAPPGPCHLQLIINSDGTSTAQTINWPGTVIQYGSTWAGANNKKAVINFWYDGTNYHMIGTNQV